MSVNDTDPRRRLAELPPGWGAVDGEAAANLEAELASELGPGHALGAVPARAVAQRFDDDSVLFALSSGRIACVRLTWSGTQESDTKSPATAIFESFDAWLAKADT